MPRPLARSSASKIALPAIFLKPIVFFMRRCAIARFLLPFAFFASVCSPPILAQIPPLLERCLPYPTLAQEIEDMRAEVRAKLPPTPAPPRIIIKSVRLEGATNLPLSARKKLIASLKLREFDDESRWLDDVEIEIRATWQDHGYFNAAVKLDTSLVSEDSKRKRFSVTAQIDEGHQYRLGDMQFVSADGKPLLFPQEQLRKLILLNAGDIFDVSKIRAGLDALKLLYGTKGYIDFTSSPTTKIDEARQVISLTWEFEAGLQYRLESIEVLGLSPQLETRLRSLLVVGEPLNSLRIDEFFKENKKSLPPDANLWSAVDISRKVRQATLSLRFDFRTSCSQLFN